MVDWNAAGAVVVVVVGSPLYRHLCSLGFIVFHMQTNSLRMPLYRVASANGEAI